MGRLQRYLRKLTDKEWTELYAAAHQELRGEKMLNLLHRLRSTGIPQTLTPSEKELAKRLERWIWKRAYILEHQLHPIYSSPPTEWIRKGALLYHSKGLSEEALSLLQSESRSPLQVLLVLFTRLRIEIEQGLNNESLSTLREISCIAEKLKEFAEREELQIYLWRLLRDYGGSHTEVGRRFLRRLEKHPYWQRPAPEEPNELFPHINLRMLYLLTQGSLSEAYQLSLCPSIQNYPSILLNRWICAIMLRHPLAEYLSLLPTLHKSHLYEQEKAILLNRLLLTLLLYSSPSYLSQKLDEIERWYLRYASLPENQFVWVQLLWLCERYKEAIQLSEKLMERVKEKRFAYLQAALILLLIYTESQTWHKLVRHLRHLLKWLRDAQNVLASASLLSRIIKKLYQARLRHKVLSAVANEWHQHLSSFPAERYFWEITLLPDWIMAHTKQQKLSEYRQSVSRSSSAEIEALLQQVAPLLS